MRSRLLYSYESIQKLFCAGDAAECHRISSAQYALRYMADTSHIPARGPREVRADSPVAAGASPRPIAPDNAAQDAASNGGQRKLVRPPMLRRAGKDSGYGLHGDSPLLTHQAAMTAAPIDEASHAEAFYFQKQVQMQTLMTFVLEDGEQIEGYIEWYDRYAIKVRNGSRTLIYKSAIKYLYKAGETFGQ